MPKIMLSEHGGHEEHEIACSFPLTTIGRHQTNNIPLASTGVSRRHAQIVFEDDNAFLVDLGSGNGTELNGHLVASNEKHLLRHGDIIGIDLYVLRYVDSNEIQKYEEEITESDVLEVKLLKKVLAALDKENYPSLEVLNGAHEGKKFFLTDELEEIVLGRDDDAGFSIPEHVISRRHAKISKKWGGIVIRDLESKNGTFVNQQRVVEETLHDGDRVGLGTILLMFRNPQEVNIAQFEQVPPKHMPADTPPEQVPLAEDMPVEETPLEQVESEASQSASDEMSEVSSSANGNNAQNYPDPLLQPLKKLTFLELGLIGLGVLILLFAFLAVVNLLLG